MVLYIYVLTIEQKGLGQRFEERRRGRPADRCLQHNPDKTKHRCSPESRRSNGGYVEFQGKKKCNLSPIFRFLIAGRYCILYLKMFATINFFSLKKIFVATGRLNPRMARGVTRRSTSLPERRPES